MLWIWISILFMSAYQMTLTNYFLNNPDYFQLNAYTWESEEFRSLDLGEIFLAEDELDFDRIAACMVKKQYDLREVKVRELADWKVWEKEIRQQKPVEFQKLRNSYAMVFSDIYCFPVPVSMREGTPFVDYADGFGDPRSYGGERRHEGCDIMGASRPRGFYPVLSMTGGVVEKVGWLEKGGWRIGIRAPSGAYFYYAHLYRYAKEWEVGEKVEPGMLLGYMGDSGYGVQEGTVGNFDVHLHLGIYLKTDHYEELSVNPYWVLRYSERFIRQADY
ncbi:MAG: M23 family metallopeptidase [Lachnospiraceae bacterium]|nr:M23 family metallopeptidase [Lachnospiraceae bacterium]